MMNFSRKVFTLIELMLVVSIIIILAGLLLPALNNAKARAKSITCMGNLKNFGLAFRAYLDDNNGKYMHENYPPGHWWGYKLTYNGYCNDISLFICPSGQSASNYVYYYKGNLVSQPLSYGYGGVSNGSEKRFQVSPSQVCVLIDCDYFYPPSTPTTWDTYKTYRHSLGSNILFADLHINREPTSQIPSNMAAYPWYYNMVR